MASDGSRQIADATSSLASPGSGNPPLTGRKAAAASVTAAEITAATARTPGTANTTARTPGTANPTAAPRSPNPQALIDQLNKHLNDSGLPNRFRLDRTGKLIQQINPATGSVVGELPASEFPALARSVGASGLLLDSVV